MMKKGFCLCSLDFVEIWILSLRSMLSVRLRCHLLQILPSLLTVHTSNLANDLSMRPCVRLCRVSENSGSSVYFRNYLLILGMISMSKKQRIMTLQKQMKIMIVAGTSFVFLRFFSDFVRTHSCIENRSHLFFQSKSGTSVLFRELPRFHFSLATMYDCCKHSLFSPSIVLVYDLPFPFICSLCSLLQQMWYSFFALLHVSDSQLVIHSPFFSDLNMEKSSYRDTSNRSKAIVYHVIFFPIPVLFRVSWFGSSFRTSKTKLIERRCCCIIFRCLLSFEQPL